MLCPQELTQLRGQVQLLSGDNRKLISDNLEMKTRFEQSRAAILKYVALPCHVFS